MFVTWNTSFQPMKTLCSTCDVLLAGIALGGGGQSRRARPCSASCGIAALSAFASSSSNHVSAVIAPACIHVTKLMTVRIQLTGQNRTVLSHASCWRPVWHQVTTMLPT